MASAAVTAFTARATSAFSGGSGVIYNGQQFASQAELDTFLAVGTNLPLLSSTVYFYFDTLDVDAVLTVEDVYVVSNYIS